jgi:hypothetical protein
MNHLVQKEENMRIRYGILTIIVIIALFLAATPAVSAYSISVSGMTTSPIITSELQSLFAGSQFSKSLSPLATSPFSERISDYSGSMGSVRAYTNNVIQNQNELIRFSESVSVSGIIKEFHYGASYKS